MPFQPHVAIAEGIVHGGGVACIRCLNALDQLKGANDDEKTQEQPLSVVQLRTYAPR